MPKATIKEVWKEAWDSPVNRLRLVVIILLVPVFLFSLPLFFNSIEKRSGVVLNDWLLAQIPPHNVSILIFAFIWSMILLILYRSLHNPRILIIYCCTLTIVTIARILCIKFVPLLPPVGLIPLSDPLSGVFYGEAAITKDLFFSGHTATLTTIFLCLEKKADRRISLISVISVAVLLVIQHIHYTIDILAAPIVTYACYRLARYILNKTD